MINFQFSIFNYHKLYRGAAGLAQNGVSAGQHLVDGLFVVMSNGDQLHIFVVFHLVFLMQGLHTLLHALWLGIRANRKAHRRVLHHVDADSIFGKHRKQLRQIIYRDEGEVSRKDGQQGLVVFDDDGGNALFQRAGGDDTTGFIGLEERFHVERNLLVLQRFQGFGMDNGGAVVRQLIGCSGCAPVIR